ncbi:MCE family protein [Leptospira gomenensis]|uniref:MCE family protein n=1 Tax=Leptospira gomenensis TaxID=2484974 RepID=A0A5F1YDQ7_9LEPT|nr:MlaD family protein [Leptospira gomenensis]TGK35466.1 MCE family protein [Leptospira gomenensis]TGK40642.1 MCE family protein [Leptospira gomenensis]TGK46320.1 MCE family protein [Leptospira gomenensis]TGK66455.1 MCE family protein [Leptospira gomenensis]
MSSLRYLLVGIIFTAAVGIVGYFTIVTEGGPVKKRGEFMKITFRNAEGIKVGNKVTVQGVPFGYVSSIRLIQIDENGAEVPAGETGIATRVEITLLLREKIRLYDNYDVIIKNESLLTGRVISIDPGTADPESDKLKSRSTPVMVVDYKKSGALKGRVLQDPLVSLSELISENRGDIRKTFSNIADITTKINTGDGSLGRLINNDDVHKNVNTVLTDAQIVLRELREGLEDTREQAPVTSFIRAALSAF